jgi:hypothetical protein
MLGNRMQELGSSNKKNILGDKNDMDPRVKPEDDPDIIVLPLYGANRKGIISICISPYLFEYKHDNLL